VRILGALDLEQTTSAVIDTVKEMAELYAADMLFIHVVPPVLYPAYAEASVPTAVNTQQLLTDGERRLRGALEGAGLAEVAKHQATFGTADREVVEYARQNDVDMIVVATHGRKGVPHVLLGSVADRIVRTADCPVLTIHPGRDPDSSGN
jgi:nucleotide-binding universal stress UspA family protein